MAIFDKWSRWRATRAKRKAALRAEEFWQWFASISETLSQSIRGGELQSQRSSPELDRWIAELNRRTAAYDPTVRAVIGRNGDVPELVITAEGDPAGAEHVRSLAASGPGLAGWKIRAFKPALSVSDCVVHAGPVTLTSNDLEFAVIDLKHPDIGERTLLLLFVPGLADTDSDDLRLAAEKLVEAIVGEEDWLNWSDRMVMEDRARPAEKVARIERQPLHQLSAVLGAIDSY